MNNFIYTYGSEIVYILCGLVCVNTGFRALKNDDGIIHTFLFWNVVGIIFMFGKYIPNEYTGMLLVFMGCLSVTKKVQMGDFVETTIEERQSNNEGIGNKIFLPAILIGLLAFLLAFVTYNISIDGNKTPVSLDGALMIGIACLVSLIVATIITKPKVKDTREDTSRLLMQMGTTSLLPQLLGALGAVFTVAGVGDVISSIISGIVPEGNIIVGVVVYVLGMAIFTMIMGNGFAAFAVITAGIGVPFVIMQGGNPAIVGALGLTSGYCGTLLTPMAANFNIVPCAVLEAKNKWTVIKAQAPIAIVMIIIHITLMLLLAF